MVNSKDFYFTKKNGYLPHFRIGIQEESKRVLISTRKIKSRWVTYNSDKIIELHVITDINAHPLENEENTFYPINDTYGVIVDKHYFANPKAITIDELFSTLGISNMSELFTDITPNGYDVVVYTRDPLLRLMSGYVQRMNAQQYEIDKRQIYDLPLDEIITIMNKNVESVLSYMDEYHDEHISIWNILIENILLCKEKLPTIIDIDNNNDDSTLGGISHREIYQKWSDSEPEYVNRFIELTSLFLTLELHSYHKLIRM